MFPEARYFSDEQFTLDSAIPFYKDTQDYLIINNKKITLDDLQNKLLVDILKEG